MFGKVVNVAQSAKSYKSYVKTELNVPNTELRIHDEIHRSQSSNRLDEIIHKMEMGYDVLYDDYTYVLGIDVSLAERIDRYRRYRIYFRTKLYTLNHEEALDFYNIELKLMSANDIEYYRAVENVWKEFLRFERKESISLSV